MKWNLLIINLSIISLSCLSIFQSYQIYKLKRKINSLQRSYIEESAAKLFIETLYNRHNQIKNVLDSEQGNEKPKIH